MELLNFDGYQGSIETSVADNVLHGKVLFINDLVTYEGATLSELNQEFRAAVADYLETCRAVGKSPEKPLTGQFNVRVGEDLHKRAMICALESGSSLNSVVVASMNAYLNEKPLVHNHVHTHELVVKVTGGKLAYAVSTPGTAMTFISTADHESTNAYH